MTLMIQKKSTHGQKEKKAKKNDIKLEKNEASNQKSVRHETSSFETGSFIV